MKKALEAEGAQVKVISLKMGTIKDLEGSAIKVDQPFYGAASVLFDAVYVPGGAKSIHSLKGEADAIHFLNEAYRHCKAIAADAEGAELIYATYISINMPSDNKNLALEGVIIDGSPADFIKAIAQHRFWGRENESKVPS